LLLALGMASCGRQQPPPSGPRRLLETPTVSGRLARSGALTLGGDTRPALLESAAYRVRLPERALLTFGMALTRAGAEKRVDGSLRVHVNAGGTTLFRHELRYSPRERRVVEASVPLTGLAGDATLELELRFIPGKGGDSSPPADLVVGLTEPTLHDLTDYGKARGIVLISIDSLRRDHVGTYGYPRPTTPSLDTLAAGGLVCEDAVSASSWTLPAHLSMFTSVDPAAHGGVDADQRFNGSVPTLARLLRDAGYATQAVTSHIYLSSAFGVDEGFEHLDFRDDRPAAEVADRAIALLDRIGDRPFLLFLHFFDVHFHYQPPQYTRALFPSRYQGPRHGMNKDFRNLTTADTPPEYLEHLLSLYDGEIRYTDDEIGRVLQHARQRGLDRSTLFVVTADHGDEFLDHGSWGHTRKLYEEIVRIPLILAGPGVAARREPRQASLLDVAPTLLDWAGLTVPQHMQGASLLRAFADREAFGDKGHAKEGGRRLFLRAGQRGWKAIFVLDAAGGGFSSEEWYDLASDPKERKPATPDPSLAAAARERTLARWQRARSLGAVRQAPKVLLSTDEVERLKALGYLAN
jgi:arylsulfatase A-like enzyme